jgi:hypothetical protein
MWKYKVGFHNGSGNVSVSNLILADQKDMTTSTCSIVQLSVADVIMTAVCLHFFGFWYNDAFNCVSCKSSIFRDLSFSQRAGEILVLRNMSRPSTDSSWIILKIGAVVFPKRLNYLQIHIAS